MIERYTILDSEANNLVRRQGRLWEMVGMEDKRLTVSNAQRERLIYVVIRDLIRNGPLEPLLSDEMLEDIHSVGLKHIHMDHKVFGMVTSNIRFREARTPRSLPACDVGAHRSTRFGQQAHHRRCAA